jgi:hypothetical protein
VDTQRGQQSPLETPGWRYFRHETEYTGVEGESFGECPQAVLAASGQVGVDFLFFRGFEDAQRI